MKQSEKSLEQRVQEIEDVEDIKRLKAAYAHAADAKYTADHQRKPQSALDHYARIQADLLTEDAIWDGRPQWEHSVGRDAFYQIARTSVWSTATHYFTMPHIVVSGDEAAGVWYLWQTGTMTTSNRAMIMSAITSDNYRRVDGKWLIAKTVFTLRYLTPIDVPWSETKNVPFRLETEKA